MVSQSFWSTTLVRRMLMFSNEKVVSYPAQNFDYFLILDFEATCGKPQLNPMEIIEFPVLKLNGRTFEIEDTFHRYVRPTINPNLTTFCTELTGIIQETVDDSDKFSQVFKDFQQWLCDSCLINENGAKIAKFAFVTCGDWDLKKILPLQCKLCNFEILPYMKSWINVKRSFVDFFNQWPTSQAYMIKYLDIQPVGRPHSGIDDCHNLAQIVRKLGKKGHIFEINSRLSLD